MIPFSKEAEHVGILRSVHGNLPNIFSRISAHSSALLAVLSAGLAKGHRGNPAASLCIELLYGVPRLLSGHASQVLNKSEKDILHSHYKQSLERLQRLYSVTPEPVVCFLGGSLPLTALLDFHQLSILGMISRLDPSSILLTLAKNILSDARPFSLSWMVLPGRATLLQILPSRSTHHSSQSSN